jgi:dTDP-3-amino-3,4,6-trideoxy-alpha-D-glucose transaminase
MQPSVPFVDLNRQHESIRADLTSAFERVVGKSSFILGEEVAAFEAEFAGYCGVKHCVGVASGTAALSLGFMAAGIGPGDEVIVPAHTFIASALGVIHAGATPVLCEVYDHDGLIDVEAAESSITDRTAAILAVHLYGQVCEMDALSRLAAQHGLALFEDSAQAHGATFRGRRAGSLGTAAAFSFYPSKNLGALGDGGAICTDDDELAERARMLRDLGQRKKGAHEITGFNERLDGLQAALLRTKLPHLDSWNAARRSHAHAYRAALGDSFELLGEHPDREPVYHLFPIRTPKPAELAAELAAVGISTGTHYAPALDEQPALAPHLDRKDAYPIARRWAADELSLPMFEGLRPDEIAHVVGACKPADIDAGAPKAEAGVVRSV